MPSILVAHAGPGSAWQAAVVGASVVLTLLIVAAAAGRLSINRSEDLALPLSFAAVGAGFGTIGSTWISDGIGWGLPLAIVSLTAVLLAGLTPLKLTRSSPLTLGALALALVATVMLQNPLAIALHPPTEMLPLADDSMVRIVEPRDGATIEAGTVQATVEVTGGSVGQPSTPLEVLGDDPEESGSLHVYIDGDRQDVAWDAACDVPDPCTTVTFDLEVPEGPSRLSVEFVRGDGTPFAPLVVDRIDVTGR